MKKIILTWLLILVFKAPFAQIVTDQIHPFFKGELDGDAIRGKFATSYIKHWDNYEKKIYLPWLEAFIPNRLTFTNLNEDETNRKRDAFRNDTSFTKNRPNHHTSFVLDSSAVIITAYGITKKNADEFEFRINQNKYKELLPWSPVKLFCETFTQNLLPDGSEELEMAYLGAFKTSFGNDLTIDLQKKGSAQIISSTTLIWLNRKPEILGVFSQSEFQSLLKAFQNQWQHDNIYAQAPLTPEQIKAQDTLYIKRRVFSSNENTLIFYLNDKVKSKSITEYQLTGNGKTQEWQPNEFDFNLIWLKYLPPGKYKLSIRYSTQRQNISEYEFEIKPAWHQTTSFKIVAGSLIAAFFGFIFLAIKTKRQKQKLKNEVTQKKQLQAQITSLRSQLHLHFIFNALNSIQGLVNKNNIGEANLYISKFGSLLHDILEKGDKNMQPLANEIKQIEYYLQLEQLRFKFQYKITVAENINTSEIDIPIMLLQPFIENAIKHGIDEKREAGIVKVDFKKKENELIITIKDNGKEYDAGIKKNGHGNTIIAEKVNALNKFLKDRQIVVEVKSVINKGTCINMFFRNWLYI